MMTVIQAIRSEKYADVDRSSSPQSSKDLPEELENMRADYEARIAKLQEEHQEALLEAKRFKAVPLVTVDGQVNVKNSINLSLCQVKRLHIWSLSYIKRLGLCLLPLPPTQRWMGCCSIARAVSPRALVGGQLKR